MLNAFPQPLQIALKFYLEAVMAHDHLKGEEDPGDGRVERGRDAAGDTAAKQSDELRPVEA